MERGGEHDPHCSTFVRYGREQGGGEPERAVRHDIPCVRHIQTGEGDATEQERKAMRRPIAGAGYLARRERWRRGDPQREDPERERQHVGMQSPEQPRDRGELHEIGRASYREIVVQYSWISVEAIT